MARARSDGDRTAEACSWTRILDDLLEGDALDGSARGSDDAVAAAMAMTLASGLHDVHDVHFNDPDANGHARGFGTERGPRVEAYRYRPRSRLPLMVMRAPFPSEPKRLDELEAEIFALLQRSEVQAAHALYQQQLGGYAHLGATLGDRARGERIVRAMYEAEPLAANLWGWPAHDLALYLLDDGQTLRARRLLEVDAPARARPDPAWHDVPRLMVRIDALLTAAEVHVAEAACAHVFDGIGSRTSTPYQWSTAGWSPWLARGLCRALAGRAADARADLNAARHGEMGPSIGVHLAEEIRLLVRIGALGQASRLSRAAQAAKPRHTNIAAALDLAAAELALARDDDSGALVLARSALARWPVSAPAPLIPAVALVEARVALRRYADARSHLDAALTATRAQGLTLLLIDALILDAHAALREHRTARAERADRAAASAAEALALARGGYVWGEGAALHTLALVDRARGTSPATHALAALEVRRRIGDARAANSAALLASAGGGV